MTNSPDRSPEPMKDTTRLDAITSGGYTLRSYGSVAEFTVTKEAMPEGPRFKDARQAIDAALASPPPPEPMKPVTGTVMPTRKELGDLIKDIVVDALHSGDDSVSQPLAERLAQYLDAIFAPPDQTPERPMSQSIEELLGVMLSTYSSHAEVVAARSALLTRYKELEAESKVRQCRDGECQSPPSFHYCKKHDPLAPSSPLRSRIASLEAELVEERKIGMRLTPGKLPEEKWDY